MARKKEEPSGGGGAPEWMATFSDLMTLILCFFVLLYSMSSIDATKFMQVVQSMNSLFNIEVGGAPSPQLSMGEATGSGLMQLPNAGTGVQDNISKKIKDTQAELEKMSSDFKTYFADKNLQDQVEVEVIDDYIKLTVMNTVLFDIGRGALKPESMKTLDMVAEKIKQYPNNEIKIEGHTDNVPISTVQFPSNWELSAARAISVAKYFVNEKGFSPQKVSTEGFGEYRPKGSNDTPEGRAVNRRVEIKIMKVHQSGNTQS